MTTQTDSSLPPFAFVSWAVGDRVARFDGSFGSVVRVEKAPFGEQNVHVAWDDPRVVDEFDGVRADNLCSETEYAEVSE